MSFFTGPSESFLDLTTETMVRKPEFADRYDAIADLREFDRNGTLANVHDSAKGNGFFRVASLQGPIESLAQLLDPDWMRNKARFYGWLSRHPQHCTFDRRKSAVPKQITFQNGEVIL